VLTHFVISDDVAGSWRFYTPTSCWWQDSDGGRAAGRRTRQQPDHHQHARRATDDKPGVTLQDQPAAHPMALISPAATAITSKLPSACLAIPEASGKPGWPLVPHRGRTAVLAQSHLGSNLAFVTESGFARPENCGLQVCGRRPGEFAH